MLAAADCNLGRACTCSGLLQYCFAGQFYQVTTSARQQNHPQSADCCPHGWLLSFGRPCTHETMHSWPQSLVLPLHNRTSANWILSPNQRMKHLLAIQMCPVRYALYRHQWMIASSEARALLSLLEERCRSNGRHHTMHQNHVQTFCA